MTVELRMLALSVVLGIVQIVVIASHAASLQRGYRWTAGPRDEGAEQLRGVAGRLERALRNFAETFPLFAAAVLMAHVSDVHGPLTEWGPRRLRAPLCRRHSGHPLAGLERRYGGHPVARRGPISGVTREFLAGRST